ncbi:DUF2209 domain-containing protein [Methanolobus halotolerans]|uniref:DUF2209 domain-containing protein n=1 Tax=Methanolobus halotolerans TaxID=2052935 RepID=A0A4E0PYI4_9EURY|nr:DUF2209 domain-containing protein [Methanolobus halotolerans]TGC11392.1 DUF2209 domain-containing protein [Methanolobus halotolerans]
MFNIIAVDISGRHKANGYYLMVCAAVAASVTADHVEKVKQINIRYFRKNSAPDVQMVVSMMEDTVSEMNFDGTVITEPGDMYNRPQWLIDSMFTMDFKYEESLSERRCMEIAHHVSLSARKLLLKELDIQ